MYASLLLYCWYHVIELLLMWYFVLSYSFRSIVLGIFQYYNVFVLRLVGSIHKYLL